MKTKVDGQPAVPRAVWSALGSAYIEFASLLLATSDRAENRRVTKAALAAQLRRDARKYLGLAEATHQLKQETRRGRPSTRPRTMNPLANLGKPGPGRPPLGKKFDRTTHRIVEERRRALAAAHKTATITAAITSLIDDRRATTGRNQLDAIKDEFNSLRASYRRGKKLSSTG
jgi:hypothetical protein